MQSARFDTADVPKAEQYKSWLRWFDRVFDVNPVIQPERGFHATSEIWALDGCALSRVSAPLVRVTRTKMLIRRNPLDPWVITIGRHTTSSMISGGREFVAPPGVPFVVSLGNELVSQREQDDRLHLYLSRDDFSDIAPILDAARGTAVDTAMGTLLADYMLMLERRLPNIPNEDLPRLKDAICAMVAACVAPTPDRVVEATSNSTSAGSNACVVPFANICDPPRSARGCCAATSAPRGRSFTGCWKVRAALPAISSVSACWRPTRCCATRQPTSRSPRSPRSSALPTHPGSAERSARNSVSVQATSAPPRAPVRGRWGKVDSRFPIRHIDRSAARVVRCRHRSRHGPDKPGHDGRRRYSPSSSGSRSNVDRRRDRCRAPQGRRRPPCAPHRAAWSETSHSALSFDDEPSSVNVSLKMRWMRIAASMRQFRHSEIGDLPQQRHHAQFLHQRRLKATSFSRLRISRGGPRRFGALDRIDLHQDRIFDWHSRPAASCVGLPE